MEERRDSTLRGKIEGLPSGPAAAEARLRGKLVRLTARKVFGELRRCN